MTVLGKMLVFLVLVLSLIWNGLVVNGYVTRTNWRNEAKKYQDQAVKAANSATEMKKLLEAEREAAEERIRALREDNYRANAQLLTVSKEKDSLLKQYNDTFAAAQKQGLEFATLQANLKRLADQVDNQDTQLREKETMLNAATLAAERARVSMTEAQIEANAQKQRAERLAQITQEQSEELEGFRRLGLTGRSSGSGRPTIPAPIGFRGTVTNVGTSGSETLVTLKPGLDAGLREGTELTVFRLGDNPRYLGKVQVLRSDPKEAIGKFIAPPNVRPGADSYPRVGDELK